jgi:hypothetical protein
MPAGAAAGDETGRAAAGPEVFKLPWKYGRGDCSAGPAQGKTARTGFIELRQDKRKGIEIQLNPSNSPIFF